MSGIRLVVSVVAVLAAFAAGVGLVHILNRPPVEPVELSAPAQQQLKLRDVIRPRSPHSADTGEARRPVRQGMAVPAYDVVRIEPSGEGVIAGRAEPGWRVIIETEQGEVATAEADRFGEWVAVVTQPLRPGEHALTLRAYSPDGTRGLVSDQTVLVSVPEAAGEETVVAVEEPGKPTRVVQADAAPAAGERASGTEQQVAAAPPGRGQSGPARPETAQAQPPSATPPQEAVRPAQPVTEPREGEAADAPPPAVAATPEAPAQETPAPREAEPRQAPKAEPRVAAAPPTDAKPETARPEQPSAAPERQAAEPVQPPAAEATQSPERESARVAAPPATPEREASPSAPAEAPPPAVAATPEAPAQEAPAPREAEPRQAPKAEPRVAAAPPADAKPETARPEQPSAPPERRTAEPVQPPAAEATQPPERENARVEAPPATPEREASPSAPAEAPPPVTTAPEAPAQEAPAPREAPKAEPRVAAAPPADAKPETARPEQPSAPPERRTAEPVQPPAAEATQPPERESARIEAAPAQQPPAAAELVERQREQRVTRAEPAGTPRARPEQRAPAEQAATVIFETIDYEEGDRPGQGTVFMTGEATPGARVFLYLNNEPVGETVAGGDGKWSYSTARGLAKGEHVMRADHVGPDGKVAARAEVTFAYHEPPTAVAEAKEPAPGGAATAAPPTSLKDQVGEAGPVQAAAAAPAAKPRQRLYYVVRKGDSLWRIAERHYGKGWKYTVIYRRNKHQIRNPHLIYPNQRFQVPR